VSRPPPKPPTVKKDGNSSQPPSAFAEDCPSCYTYTTTQPRLCTLTSFHAGIDCPMYMPPKEPCIRTASAATLPGPNPACETTPTVTVLEPSKCTTYTCPQPGCQTVTPIVTGDPMDCSSPGADFVTCGKYVTVTERIYCLHGMVPRATAMAARTGGPVRDDGKRVCTVFEAVGGPCPPGPGMGT
jgi:hypothetical protein